MRRFASLYDRIDRASSTNAKVDAIADYLREAPRADAAWAVYFLMGRKLRKLMKAGELAGLAAEIAGIPGWLFDESHEVVGDLAETISLVLETAGALPSAEPDVPLHEWVEERLERLRLAEADQKRRLVGQWWAGLDRRQVFLLVKLLTGSLRVGVSSTLASRAVGVAAGLSADEAAERLMGDFRPSAGFLEKVFAGDPAAREHSRPYPFFLASPVEPAPAGGDQAAWLAQQLGDVGAYQAEWKWDGIRAQVIRRAGETVIWSRGEELLTERFPEVLEAAAKLRAACVLDGELLAWRSGRPLGFAKLQKRIGRTSITARALAESPVVFIAYDLLEAGGEDVRSRTLADRRRMLESLIGTPGTGPAGGGMGRVLLSPVVDSGSWAELADARQQSRARGVEGLMLKRLDSLYGVGRQRGAWWKWKVDPLVIDAVLVYAQPGHGRRANLLTDYTLGVWDGDNLVPVAKAYSGLSDDEIRRMDAWIKEHTVRRIGPVRIVEPGQVFEVHFEGITASPRHRSGISFRFPRISRWRTDKQPPQADTLETVRRLMGSAGGEPERTIFELGEAGDDGADGRADQAGGMRKR